MSETITTDIYGWHFGNGILGYGDGRPVVVGETLTVEVEPVLCQAGLHASVNALDALNNAQSMTMAYRVRLSGKIAKPTREHPDKHAATERTVLAAVEFGPVAQMFIRDTLSYRQPHLVTLLEQAGLHDHAQAIKALDMYGDLEVVDGLFKDAARAARAARAAAWAAARAAWDARDAWAARDAAWAAARAAWDARDAWAARDAAEADLNVMLERRLYEAMGTVQGESKMDRTTQALAAGTAALLVAKNELLRLGGSVQVMDVIDGGLTELDEERKALWQAWKLTRQWSIDREMEAREMEQAYAEGVTQ